MASRSSVAGGVARCPCLNASLVLSVLVSTALLLAATADSIPDDLLQRWTKAVLQKRRLGPNFDEDKIGIVTMNMGIEETAPEKGDVTDGSVFSCLNRHLSDEVGLVHIVGYKPEIRDSSVEKIVLYGCPELSSGESESACIAGCRGPSVIIYEWARDGCPDYLSKGETVNVGGPYAIHELVLEVQHAKGTGVSSGLTLKVMPETFVRSDKTVAKLIAYYNSQTGFEPCSTGSSSEDSPVRSAVPTGEEQLGDTPENVIVPGEEGDYRFARAYPARGDSPYETNGLEAEMWWPRENLRLGQVAGVAVDRHGLVYAFQRGERRWLDSDFDSDHVFKKKMPILNDVVLMMDPHSGYVLDSWGGGRFYMPHGITIDHAGNMWLTDVAMHQVFKFPPGAAKPSKVYGKRFQPGSDWKHFCQPTDVAVDSKTGNFFVADGYCNSRVLKFAPNGSVLMEITAPSSPDQPEELRTFNIPHSLALAEKRQLLCVADRENGRILCFNSTTGEYDRQIASSDFGGRVFAVAYDESEDLLYAVNGPTDDEYYPTQGFTIDLDSGRIISTWSRPYDEQEQMVEPHDLAVYSGAVYVADVAANRVWKFWNEATPSNDIWENQPWKN